MLKDWVDEQDLSENSENTFSKDSRGCSQSVLESQPSKESMLCVELPEPKRYNTEISIQP